MWVCSFLRDDQSNKSKQAPRVKEGFVAEDRLKIAVFVDFDNIQIGVKETLGKDFDVSIVLEALKERGEVVSKTAYGDWPRANDYSRQMTQHAIHMVQRSVTPRGDKNGADINLALDALEMAFTHNHINTYVIVGGDSDFIALVEKLKQYDKRVFVVGGRQFTSGILQRNCHEFISYENLLKTGSDGGRSSRAQRAAVRGGEARALTTAMPNIQRALQVLAERGVAPQLGLLKSTLLQLDPTFSERDFGTGSFLEFIQKLRKAGLVEMRRTDRGYLVEIVEGEGAREIPAEPAVEAAAGEVKTMGADAPVIEAPVAEGTPPAPIAAPASPEDSLAALRAVLPTYFAKAPNRPLYLRQIRQILRGAGSSVDERSGFRGLLDLLHQAQRESWVRLHRDRKGVWRIFPGAPAPVIAPAGASESAIEPPPEIETDLTLPAETDVSWESSMVPDNVVEVDELATPLVVEQIPTEETAPEPKTRKSRGSKAGTKSPRRKASSRRKVKEPEQATGS